MHTTAQSHFGWSAWISELHLELICYEILANRMCERLKTAMHDHFITILFSVEEGFW